MKTRALLVFIAPIIVCSVFGVLPVAATYSEDGTAICSAPRVQNSPKILSDVDGGAFVLWGDPAHVEFIFEAYAQRIDGWGNPLWPSPDGMSLGFSTGFGNPARSIVSDGVDGFIAIFVNTLDMTEIRVQRYTQNLVRPWGVSGKRVCVYPGPRRFLVARADVSGGVIVAWQEEAISGNEIRAQKFDADGNSLWGDCGIVLCEDIDPYSVYLEPDGAGGAYYSWTEVGESETTLYLQRITAAGVADWSPAVQVFQTSLDYWHGGGELVGVGAGYCVIVWYEHNQDGIGVYRTQLYDLTGTAQWNVGGAATCTESARRGYLSCTATTDGCIVVGWSAFYTEWDQDDIYVQKMGFDGTRLWGDNGTTVCEADSIQTIEQILSDDDGGVIVAWWGMGETGIGSYVQRVDLTGNPDWSGCGVPFPGGSSTEFVADGYGGLVGVWSEDRGEGSDRDIYAARIRADGTTEVELPKRRSPVLGQNIPNPFNPQTTIAFDLPSEMLVSLRVYDVSGRLVDVLVDGEMAQQGRNEVVWRGRDQAGRLLPSGTYFYRLEAGGFSETKRMMLLK